MTRGLWTVRWKKSEVDDGSNCVDETRKWVTANFGFRDPVRKAQVESVFYLEQIH